MISFNRLVTISIVIVFLLLGCSSIQVSHHSRGMYPPFCKNEFHQAKIVVYWDTAWRLNQKEVGLREKLLDERINLFFSKSDCFSTIKIARNIGGKSITLCSDSEVVSDARSMGAEKAIVIRIEEAGPNLMRYLSPILWQTKNEVLLRVRVIDSRSESIESDISSHWYRGGPFMLLGTSSLHKDIDGTLEAIFYGERK